MKEERPITALEIGNPAETAPLAGMTEGSVDGRDPEFDRLYETYVPLLRRIATRKFNVPYADVDELVQDVFATYLTHAARVRELRPYLIGGICNAARQYWREKDAQRKVFCDADPDSAASDDAVLESLIRNTLMAAALSRLGTSCRETLHRFYIDGESAISIAASRETTQNSIHQLLNYCRGRARAAYLAMKEVL
ncbi:MAG TPA: sigma-70 family RNA polymerase sigma factor [Thermoanaerobaculia bacterium]